MLGRQIGVDLDVRGKLISDYILHLYRQMPSAIKAIIADDGTTSPPLIDLPGKFFKSHDRPWGIPAWKVSKD